MAREVTLNDPAAVQFIRQQFIPWAGNNVDLFYDKQSPEKVHEFAQRWGLRPGGTTSYQVVSPGGKRIAVWDTSDSPSIHFGRQLVAFLEKTLPKDPRPPRKLPDDADAVTPERGVGLREDGAAKLAVTTRRMDKNDKGMMVDSLVVPLAELNGLHPPEVAVGVEYELPEKTSRRFIEVCVHADGLFSVKPEEATSHKLTAQVTRDDEIIEVRFAGKLGLETNGKWERAIGHGEGRAQGRLRFDRDGRLQELLLVYRGHFHNWYTRNWDPDYPVEGVIEWRAAR